MRHKLANAVGALAMLVVEEDSFSQDLRPDTTLTGARSSFDGGTGATATKQLVVDSDAVVRKRASLAIVALLAHSEELIVRLNGLVVLRQVISKHAKRKMCSALLTDLGSATACKRQQLQILDASDGHRPLLWRNRLSIWPPDRRVQIARQLDPLRLKHTRATLNSLRLSRQTAAGANLVSIPAQRLRCTHRARAAGRRSPNGMLYPRTAASTKGTSCRPWCG
mmetsp:Transcript_116589/g.212140  ORF Transcript_116589/g.212140 Transcript_116589/m.212140 type:complete len:223 (-) Transcript_116589:265-933(-)